MSSLEIVDLSVDDNSNEIFSNDYIDHNRNQRKPSSNACEEITETIDLEEESSQTLKHNQKECLIEISLDPINPSNTTTIHKNNTENGRSRLKSEDYEEFKKIFMENRILANIIEMCLNFKDSSGMLRVISTNVLPLYNEIDENYKKSVEFSTVLKETLQRLIYNENFKFSHMKSLCDIMQQHKKKIIKKKVEITTLATNLKVSSSKAINKVFNDKEIIDLDSEEPFVIDLDDYQDDVICLDEKENQSSQTLDNNYLVPIAENPVPSESSVDAKIKLIEERIGHYKKLITELDEREVDCDDNNSPYLLSEKYKEYVVSCYKELCDLTGKEAVKRRKVRLQVRADHPKGPVKNLQKFLNDNILEDGDPPFPDFVDVIKCVDDANVQDKIGWQKPQILNEARRLFEICGKELQKRRQKREWKDLISKVKKEEIDDPADRDPELQAKLQFNRRIALRKENEVFERFSYFPPAKKSRTEFSETDEEYSFNEDNEDITELPPLKSCNSIEKSNVESEETSNNETESHNDVESSQVVPEVVKIKKEPEEELINSLEQIGNDYTAVVTDIEDPFLIVEVSDSSEESDIENETDNNTL